MKKIILGIGLVTLLSGAVFAQRSDTRASSNISNQTSVSKNGGNAVLQSGTQITGQLQNSLDVQKARVGDQVVLKTTSAIKQNGRVVVDKGSRLIGRVTEVQQRARGNAASRVSILFDRIENGKMTLPIDAMITSVSQVRARGRADEDIDAGISGNSSARASSGNQGGGLLGGVTNTVGGVLNTTGQTVGSVANTAGQTVGGIQISQSGSASAEGSSTLSLTGGNLRLEKGTAFNLRLTESASIGNN